MKEMTYEDLAEKYNELIDKYNALADRYNRQGQVLKLEIEENRTLSLENKQLKKQKNRLRAEGKVIS